jgi:hypothetical protein
MVRKLIVMVAVVAGLGVIVHPDQSWATSFWTGSGANAETGGHLVSAAADFTVTSPTTFTVLLKNTTSGGTLAQGDYLMGVVFDLGTNNKTLSLSVPITLPAGSDVYTSKTITNDATTLTGSWTDKLGTPLRGYGVAATGFNGAFAANGISRGNGGPDYGIIAPGTLPNASNTFAQFPVIQNALSFSFALTSGTLTESDIQNVDFLFGTAGTGIITGVDPPPPSSVPEPSTALMLAAGLSGLGAWAMRMRKLPDHLKALLHRPAL